jgi:hypothetical protein
MELTNLYSQPPEKDTACGTCGTKKASLWVKSKLKPGTWLCKPCSGREVRRFHRTRLTLSITACTRCQYKLNVSLAGAGGDQVR